MPTASNLSGPGLQNFFSAPYQTHNRARLDHLASLGLPLAKRRVLELGSGPGDHTGFYVERECSIVSVDSRQDCLDTLRSRYPNVQTIMCDLNSPAPLVDLGVFDVIHCYGILYHLENPEQLIRFMSSACSGLALVETCVQPDDAPGPELVDETEGDYTQSSTGRGCRPTRRWVFERLGHSFPFVYHTRTQPNHPEFPIDWKNLQSTPPLIRSVFVASKQPLELPALSPVLLDRQERLDSEVYIAELEAQLAEQFKVMQEREQLIYRLHDEASLLRGQLEQAHASFAQQKQQTALLERIAEERLAAMHEKDAAMAGLHSQLLQSLERATTLEAAAVERLAALQATDSALNQTRADLKRTRSELEEQFHRSRTET